MEAVFSDFGEYAKAFGLTCGLFLVAGLGSLVWGTFLAALRVGPVAVMRKASAAYVGVFRNTPLLVVFIFVAVALPKIGYSFTFIENVDVGGHHVSGYFFRACVALTLYTSAFVCEAVRSGINAVPLGQAEAARSIGLTFTQTMQEVVLPQAVRAVVPPLTSVLVALLKNTSVAAAFGIAEATAQMKSMNNDHADQRIQIFLLFAVGYIVLVEVLTFSSYALERRWRVA
ncbi:amino acid ABC transporter permease [Nocardioides sp. T2.26MG-1]|uniref:amino acid ABC transporter permease n=1 Tax=Nocardioides sp. T2.26MG-1 TaxID=3041166 RepID=UPI0024773DDF|nr:amino acid ABC transporter permease [Nocardioides sp. T2.26MG-1]CAI9416441.1 putative glutamine ABC transporter permease protein GlnP [Nocardioides sp. T2.26MG-1]